MVGELVAGDNLIADQKQFAARPVVVSALQLRLTDHCSIFTEDACIRLKKQILAGALRTVDYQGGRHLRARVFERIREPVQNKVQHLQNASVGVR